MSDGVDQIIDQWRRERPDLDVWTMGIVGRVSRLALLFDRELKAFFAKHGLERFEFDVLATLRRAGEPYELTPGALHRSAMITTGAITHRVDRAEAKGLVERVRDSADRRSVRIRLTDRGLALVDEVVASHLANEARLLASLDPDQREQLAALLRILLEDLGDTPWRDPD
jgi:DNA-binding MarR family transcriptional regulator